MTVIPKYYADDWRLVKQTDRPGHAPDIDIYVDRRAGMSFPTGNTPGYYCVFGLKEVITHRDKLPLELLAEGSFSDQDQMFISLCRNMVLLGCEHVYADCGREFESSEIEFEKYIRRSGIKTIGLWDASEFEGFKSSYAGFEAARAPLDEYGRKGLLRLPKSTLKSELSIITADDMIQSRPWESFPAINAFNHVVMSYVISPWEKPEKEFTADRRNGYGG